MATPDNPFLALKARLVVLVFFAISLGLGLLLVVLSAINLLPLQADDPILAPILYSLIFSSLCLAILIVARRSPIQLAFLIGPWPPRFSWVRLLGLVMGVFLFSLGTFQLFYLGLSFVAPEWVETSWQQSVLFSAQKTVSPRLYTAVVFFSVVVVAPVTEEFIFRGVLLHRWGVKWGVRPAILMTSILFGLLHSNLVGLFVFGVVMALLYLSTRSLLVPMVAHALNNAIASGIEWFTTQIADQPMITAQRELQTTWWLGLVGLLLSSPWVIGFVTRHWPPRQIQLPYFANQKTDRLAAETPSSPMASPD